jgi:hypothetical protein
MLNDVYGSKKDESESKYWQLTNRYIAAIQMESCIASKMWMSEERQLCYIFGFAAALAASVAVVEGFTVHFFCIIGIISVPAVYFKKELFDKIHTMIDCYREWINQSCFVSLSIDPDSIEQQVTSLRLVRHFRANHLAAN